MARSKGFPLLFLLTLILGCFLSASRAISRPEMRVIQHENFDAGAAQGTSGYRVGRTERSEDGHRRAGEEVGVQAEVDKTEDGYRSAEDLADSLPASLEDKFGFRRAQRQFGFRRNFITEIRDMVDSFENNYLNGDKCDKLKEKLSKGMGFIRVALDFIN